MTRLQEGVVAFPLSPISKRLCWPPVGLRVGTDIKHPFFAREDSSGLWRGAGTIRLEQDVFSALAGQDQIVQDFFFLRIFITISVKQELCQMLKIVYLDFWGGGGVCSVKEMNRKNGNVSLF